jgi:Icc-related predicted phosphoesterase
MKIAVASDLHLEFADLDLVNDQGADVLILSGDIMIAQDLHDHPQSATLVQAQIMGTLGSRQAQALRFRGFLERCSERFPHVVYVAGNHEFYHGKWVQNIQDLRDECAGFANVHFLERDSVTIDGVLFVGGTLWTDMNRGDPLTLHSVVAMMSDFQIIRNDAKGFRRLSAMDTVDRHMQTKGYIKTVLEQNPDTPTVVVGHHAPTHLSTHPRYANDTLMNGAYRSDLSDMILDHSQIRLWTHGHTHEDFDYMLGATRIVCNPRGYLGHESRADHFQLKILEI